MGYFGLHLGLDLGYRLQLIRKVCKSIGIGLTSDRPISIVLTTVQYFG